MDTGGIERNPEAEVGVAEREGLLAAAWEKPPSTYEHTHN